MPVSASVLVTRPREDSEMLAPALRKAGLTPVIVPLLSIEYTPPAADEMQADLFVVTSRYGLEALARHDVPRSTPLIVTGEYSADRARDMGFSNVHTLERAIQVPLLAAQICAPSARILYLSGRDVTLDIAAELRAEGLDAKRLVTYTAHAQTALAPEVLEVMPSLKAALFFSARSASIYAALVKQYKLEREQAHIVAFCLSEEVAAAARDLPFAGFYWPQKTDTQALLDDVISRIHLLG